MHTVSLVFTVPAVSLAQRSSPSGQAVGPAFCPDRLRANLGKLAPVTAMDSKRPSGGEQAVTVTLDLGAKPQACLPDVIRHAMAVGGKLGASVSGLSAR